MPSMSSPESWDRVHVLFDSPSAILDTGNLSQPESRSCKDSGGCQALGNPLDSGNGIYSVDESSTAVVHAVYLDTVQCAPTNVTGHRAGSSWAHFEVGQVRSNLLDHAAHDEQRRHWMRLRAGGVLVLRSARDWVGDGAAVMASVLRPRRANGRSIMHQLKILQKWSEVQTRRWSDPQLACS